MPVHKPHPFCSNYHPGHFSFWVIIPNGQISFIFPHFTREHNQPDLCWQKSGQFNSALMELHEFTQNQPNKNPTNFKMLWPYFHIHGAPCPVMAWCAHSPQEGCAPAAPPPAQRLSFSSKGSIWRLYRIKMAPCFLQQGPTGSQTAKKWENNRIKSFWMENNKGEYKISWHVTLRTRNPKSTN